MMAFTLDAVRQLVRGFATASLAFGIISLITGTSGVSCALQLASGAHWLSITQSGETFTAALAASSSRASCCGASLKTIRGVNIAGIVIGVLDGIWVRLGRGEGGGGGSRARARCAHQNAGQAPRARKTNAPSSPRSSMKGIGLFAAFAAIFNDSYNSSYGPSYFCTTYSRGSSCYTYS